ncbi:MAG: hypothetical protein RXQ96_04690 [Thermocladium sp.]
MGGSLLRSGKDYANLAPIINDCIPVISAMRGVTDKLVLAAQRQDINALNEIHDLYIDALNEVSPPNRALYMGLLRDVASSAMRHLLMNNQDAVIAHGELFSIIIMAAALETIGANARPVYDPGILIEESRSGSRISGLSGFYVRQRLTSLINRGIIPVIPGFIGWFRNGTPGTLGRGGSDYTASLLAYYLGASQITFYTDVPGIYSGDPRIVNNPRLVDSMSIEEAYVFSIMGGKKFHPKTFEPLIDTDIVAVITMPGSGMGTIISRKTRRGPKAVAVFDAARIGGRGYAVAVIGHMDPREVPIRLDFRDRGGNAFGLVLGDEENAAAAARSLHEWVISWAR